MKTVLKDRKLGWNAKAHPAVYWLWRIQGGWANGAEEIALQWICYGNTGSLKSSDGVQQLKIKK